MRSPAFCSGGWRRTASRPGRRRRHWTTRRWRPPERASIGAHLTESAVKRSGWQQPAARRVRAIRDRLRLVYGIPGWGAHGHPIAELVLTVLSQSTNDRNRDVAYLRLRERFDDGDVW